MSAIATVSPKTLATLIHQLGDIPPERIFLEPTPGTATEEDALRFIDGDNKRLVELIDGTLVEKPMGAGESSIGLRISGYLFMYMLDNPIGELLGPDGPIRISPKNFRMPDVTFLAYDDMPDGKRPNDKILDVVPTLTVEVLSESNTKREIDQKLEEYFKRGCKLSWVVDPDTKTIRVHTSPKKFKLLSIDDTLTGGTILSGFKVKVTDLFQWNRRKKK